jgi:hypothetical protein
MVKVVQLNSVSGGIRLDIGKNGWSRCYLVSDRRIYLGAETQSYLTHNLLKTLNNNAEDTIGEISGHPVRWGLSLTEAHCTLYVATQNSAQIMFWQDADGRLIGRIELSDDEVEQWRKQLEMLL